MDLTRFNEIFLKVTNEHFNTKSPSTWTYAHGQCMFYAYVVSKIFNAKAKSYICYKKESGHCFVKIGKKYYDADCPQGMDNWRKLQKYLRNVQNVKSHRGSSGILKHWGYDNPSKKKDWDFICSKVQSLLLEESISK